MRFALPKFAPALTAPVALVACALAGCGDPLPAGAPTERDVHAAYAAKDRVCPANEDEILEELSGRAAAGDIAALDCLIASYRAMAMHLDHQEAIGAFEEYGEEGEDLSDLPRGWLMGHLYVRWRLTGERLDELQELARTMDKAAIEGALYLGSVGD